MGNGYQNPIIPPSVAFSRGKRVRMAFRFIRDRARDSIASLERTKAAQVANTYGLEAGLIKRMKARFRNELTYYSEGK